MRRPCHARITLCWLGALTAYMLAGITLISAVSLNGVSPPTANLVRSLFAPVKLLPPWVAMVAMMALFAAAGRSRSKAKLIARIISATIVFLPIAYMLMGVAFSGTLTIDGTETVLLGVTLACAGILGVYGFSRDSTGYSSTAFEP